MQGATQKEANVWSYTHYSLKENSPRCHIDESFIHTTNLIFAVFKSEHDGKYTAGHGHRPWTQTMTDNDARDTQPSVFTLGTLSLEGILVVPVLSTYGMCALKHHF